ncbi:MAG: permease [Gammaproteobacteria bacterium]|nr:permease [Gammaproteobacteria bacterium]
MTSDCCESENQAAVAAEDAGCGTESSRDTFLWFCLASVASLSLAGLFIPHTAETPGMLATLSHGVVELLGKMWWGMAIGVIFVGLLARIPRDLVMSVLGHEKGFTSLLRATLAGVFLDLCSHGILAVGMKLYERGASVGQVMAFLLASPWNSFSLTLILFGLIGVGWTLLFILLSLVIGLISGTIFDGLVRRGSLPENPNREHLDADADPRQLWAEFRASWRFSGAGAGRLLQDGFSGSRVVIRWGLFGILLASVIRVLVPETAFAAWFGASMAGLGLTILAATLIEVCSEGTTPIAADLMNRAGAPGNAFTFLMAGVATDYTEIMSIRDTTASWKIALFLPLVTLPQVLLIGAVLNQFPG